MKRVITFGVLMLLLTGVIFAEDDTVHQDWIEKDRVFAIAVRDILKTDPQHADQVLFGFPVERKKLGFGYTFASASVGKGYLNFSCEMLYFHDELVSFRIAPGVCSLFPEVAPPRINPDLHPLYVGMLRDMFSTNSDGSFKTFSYNGAAATAELPGCEVKVRMSEKMKWFCSPFSGIAYGTTGGYAGGNLGNRDAYLQVTNEFDSQTCLRLLYSINPATRLTAYEHYRRHEAAFEIIKEKVESRMGEVFKEMPQVETMEGCIILTKDSRQVVESILDSGN